jgi:hypothetical protein
MIRWDPSATEWLPEYMKGVYMVVYETVNEMAERQRSLKAETRSTMLDKLYGKYRFIHIFLEKIFFSLIALTWSSISLPWLVISFFGLCAVGGLY